jgi:hypothetical protein
MAGSGGTGLFQLLCSTRKLASSVQLSHGNLSSAAMYANALQSATLPVLGALQSTGEALHPAIPQYPSVFQ